MTRNRRSLPLLAVVVAGATFLFAFIAGVSLPWLIITPLGIGVLFWVTTSLRGRTR